MTANKQVKVIILGGGFGGLYAAMHLDHVLDRSPGLQVTFIRQSVISESGRSLEPAQE